MSEIVADMRSKGELLTKHFKTINGKRVQVKEVKKAPISWKLKNIFRIAITNKFPYVHFPFLAGWLWHKVAKGFSYFTGIATMTPELSIKLIKADGTLIDYGVVGYKVVTDAGVGFLVDDWDDDTTDITTMNFHASGTGAGAEAVGETALVAEATTITDRIAGTKSQPAANQLRTVGTQSFTGAGAIIEHGLLSIITEGAGVLWDRTLFTVINVANLDSIEFTYTCTVNSGG